MNYVFKVKTRVATFIFLTCLPCTVVADKNEEIDLFSLSLSELINVTVEARKVEEDLQRTPISVSVMSNRFLKERSLTNLLEASYFIPNIEITTVGENSGCTHCAGITMRGVGQVDPIPTTDPSVGIYIDGVYHARSAGGIYSFLDIDRIEVLRGPQGTLFGKNTIGGAINMFTNKVTDKKQFNGQVTIGEFNRKDASVIFNSPISDNVSARLALSKNYREGFVTRDNGDKEGGRDDLNVIAKLNYKQSEQLNFELSYYRQLQNNDSAPSVLPKKNDDASLIVLYNSIAGLSPAIDPYPKLTVFDDNFRSASTDENENHLNQYGYRANIEWDISDQLKFKSITSYRSLEAVYGRDFDNNSFNIGVTRDYQTQKQTSQEFNLTGNVASQFDWLLGLFAIDEEIHYLFNFTFIEGLYLGLETIPGPLDGSPLSNPTAIGGAGNPLNIGLDLDNTFNNDIESESVAAFFNGNYRFDEQWTLTLGGRITREKKKQQVITTRNIAQVIAIERTDTSPEGPIEKSWRVFSPLASVQYQASNNMMLFLTGSRGFKSGGFNGVANTPVSARPFDPEYLTAFELGMRSQWFDNTLRLNATAFFMKHKDMQLRGGESGEDSGVEIFIDNVGNTETQGAEIEFERITGSGFTFSGSLSYTDAKFTDVGTATEVTTDSKLIKTPKWTASMGVKYNWELSHGQQLSTRLDWAYRSKVYNDVFNSPFATQQSIALVNVSANYQLSESLSVTAFVTNLTNKYHVIGSNDFTASFGVAEFYLAPPRQAGVGIQYQF